MNVNDCFEVSIQRKKREWRAEEERKEQIFFNKCLREIDGRDAYDFLAFKTSKLLGGTVEESYRFVLYYFENQEHFDCSFDEWLLADNGPLLRKSIYGLFPEFELITNDEYKIAELAREHYGIEIFHCDEYSEEVYCFEFSFIELNKKRVDLKDIESKIEEYTNSLIKKALEE